MKKQKENISVIISFIVVIFFVGVVVYILMNRPEKEADPLEGIKVGDVSQTENQQSTTKEQSSTSQNKMRALDNFTPVAKTATLQKTDLVVGTGEEVKPGATVSVHYTGAVAATGAIFQSSKDFGTNPVTFPLANVIKGWTDGIPGMKVGGTRRLVIPADMAYGATPPPGSGIPANADLVFDVELVSVQ